MSLTSTVDKTGPFVVASFPQVVSVGFPFQGQNDFSVLNIGGTTPHDPAITLAPGSDYTVTGGGYNTSNQMQGGTISVVTTGVNAVQIGDVFWILRNVPITQAASAVGSPLTAILVEEAMDKTATISQMLQEQANRSLRFEAFETFDGTLNLALRKNSTLSFDSNGKPIFNGGGTGSSITSIATLIQLPTASLGTNTVVQVLGYYTPGDGGGGVFYYNNTSSATANGGTIIAPSSGVGRWFREILDVVSNPRWFGATGNGVTDDSAAINSSFSCARLTGGVVRITAGSYACASPLILDQSALVGISSLTRVNIIGDGSDCTQINFTSSTVNAVALTLLGGDFISDGWDSRQTIKGLQIITASPLVSLGQTGLLVNKAGQIFFEDIYCVQCYIGASLTDVVGATFISCYFSYNNYGMKGQPGSSFPSLGTPPNELTFIGCHFVANRNYGATFDRGAPITFIGGSFEGNGNLGTDTNRYAITVSNGGYNGGGILNMRGVEFEENGTLADVWIQHNLYPGTYDISGCCFSRNGLAGDIQANHSIQFDTTGSSPAFLKVTGCGFTDVNGFAPTTSQQYIAYGTVSGNNYNADITGNTYASVNAIPSLTGPVFGPSSNASAWVLFNGTNATISKSFNVTSVTRNSAGDYTVNFQRNMQTTTYLITPVLLTGVGDYVIVSRSVSQIRFQTINLSSVGTDFVECGFIIFGGGSPVN